MAACASCAHELEDGDRFCTHCGARVGVDPPMSAFEQVASAAPDAAPIRESDALAAPIDVSATFGRTPAEVAEVIEVGAAPDTVSAAAEPTSPVATPAAAGGASSKTTSTKAASPKRTPEEPPPLSPRKAAVGVVLALLVVAGGLVFAFSRGGSSRNSNTSATALVHAISTAPVSRWKATVRGGAYGARSDGDTVFVVSTPPDGDVQVVALKVSDGSTLWAKPIAAKSSVASLRLFSQGLAVAVGSGQDHTLLLLDRVSGVQRWKTTLDEGYAFSDSFLGPYVSAKDGDEQVLGLLDLAKHRVTRTARGRWLSMADGKLVTVTDGRISVLDPKTFERSRPSIVADAAVQTAVVVTDVVVAALGKDLVGFDKTGRPAFTERLSVGDIASLRPIGRDRVAVSGGDGAAVVVVSATKADILWDQKHSAVLGTERLGASGYVLIARLGADRLSLVEGSAKDPGELGSTAFPTAADAGTNAFVADGGVYTFTAVDGRNHLAAYDLKAMEMMWELKGSSTASYFGVVDRAVVSYTPGPDTTTIELER